MNANLFTMSNNAHFGYCGQSAAEGTSVRVNHVMGTVLAVSIIILCVVRIIRVLVIA